jgi:hypothetical protein
MFKVGDLVRLKEEKEVMYPSVAGRCGVITTRVWNDLDVWMAFFDEDLHNVTITVADFEKVG